MLTAGFAYSWDYWELRSKVTFDGVLKTITVNPDVVDLDIRSDVYTYWVQWLSLQDNQKYFPAMRFTGLDPIPGGFTGDSYFLINGWKLVFDPSKVAVTGILYSDDYDTPYYLSSGKPVYPATVSSLVNNATTTVPALSEQNIVDLVSAVWDAKISNYLSAGSTGAKLNEGAVGQVDNTEVLAAITDQTTTINAHTDVAVQNAAIDDTAILTAISNQTTAINDHTDVAVQNAAIDDTAILTAISSQTAAINAHTDIAVQNASFDDTDILLAIDNQTVTLSNAIDAAEVDPSVIWNYFNRSLTDPVEIIVEETTFHNALDTYDGKDLYKAAQLSSTTFHNMLNSYANKNDWKADVSGIDNTPVLAAINNLNDISLLDIETSPVLAKEATVLSIDNTDLTPASIRAAFNPAEFKNSSLEIHTYLDSYQNKEAWKESAQADVQPVLDAIAGLNDASVADIRAAFNPADFKDKNTQAEIHNWLDTYANKNLWKATVTPTNLQPVLDAIDNLNDVSASEVVNLINPELFKSKNTETEIHSYLDSYGNKAFWKADVSGIAATLTAVQNLNDMSESELHLWLNSYGNKNLWKATVPAPTDIQPVLDAVAAINQTNFNETDLHSWLNTYTNKDAWKSTYTTDLTPVLTAINSLNNVSVTDIEQSTVLAKQLTVDAVAATVNALENADLTPVLTAISNLNDVTAAEVRAAFNPNDFKDGVTEAVFHTWLDTYDNTNWITDPTVIADAVWNTVL